MKKEYVVELSEEEADELMEEHWVGELVRCKDCKHYNVKSLYCEYDLIWENRSPDWYCADGERKSDK